MRDHPSKRLMQVGATVSPPPVTATTFVTFSTSDVGSASSAGGGDSSARIDRHHAALGTNSRQYDTHR